MPRSRRPFTAHDCLRLQACSDPQLAPDRRMLAWVRTWADAERNGYQAQLMLTSLTSGTSQALTAAPLVAAQPRWSPDGQTLAYVATTPRSSAPQLYTIPASGGTPRQLTTIRGGVVQPTWSPEGQSISLQPLVYPPPPPAATPYERFTRDILVTQQPLVAHQSWGQPSHCVVVTLHGEPKVSIIPITLEDAALSRTLTPIETPCSGICNLQSTIVNGISPCQAPAVAASQAYTWPSIGDQIMLAACHDTAGHALIALLADQFNPGDLYLLHADTAAQRLTTLNAGLLNELLLAPCLRFSHSKTQGWVIPPQGYCSGQRYPAILDLRPHPPSFKPAWQTYAAQGYAVICGEGVAHQAAFELVAAACASYPFIDPKRIVIIGGPDVVHVAETQPTYPLIADCRQQPHLTPELHLKAKPRATLVLATSNHYAGEQLYTSLGQRGVAVELVRLPSTNHPLLPALRPWHHVFALERCLAWLNRAGGL
ncbi:S9 family peptidase [Candidatus Viridilinea mediisalina]|uniref:Peptidase S9 prolyl oligopeptidase catalytic domain-containing protein n=1 Tax=Candidatus Viridilinea mediisalina TaxID=2024553 RepID=A0A2A6RN47_9CHLR|nr:PD40 domain-containing protein [Candidatus Viridilinea mediisalina]PDW04346.1 hypothetical protein CJ255_04120 [Candidatus Viridilinea mediisalina]